ncbi:MAG: prepilin-type N-terminal cleavage/methylation domain-containing protein [bacterium]
MFSIFQQLATARKQRGRWAMFAYGRSQRGFMFLEILLVLVIIAILSGWYFTKDKDTQLSYYQTRMDQASDTACLANRQAVLTKITAWQINHGNEPFSLEAVEKTEGFLPKCPQGGKYFVDKDGKILCTLHDLGQTPEPVVPGPESRSDLLKATDPKTPAPANQ